MPALSLKPSSKGVTVLVIMAVVILFGCVLAYVGAAGKLKTATDELAKKERLVNESKQIAQKLEKSRLDYFEACSQVRYLESSVSSRDYVPTLLKQIERLGKSVNLKVLAVRPQEGNKKGGARSVTSGAKAAEGNVESASKEKNGQAASAAKTKPYDELTISLEVEGSYMNALSFLYRLTTFPKIVSVSRMEMAPSKNALALMSPRLSIKMTVTAFVLKENQPADTVAPTPEKSARRPASKAHVAGRYSS
jgi:Tfp pilus assembly protein PilO